MHTDGFDTVLWAGVQWLTHDLSNDYETYQVSPTFELLVANTTTERLPEEEWPTKPGEEWHGLVGTTKTYITAWQPTLHTGTIHLKSPDVVVEMTLVNGRVAQIIPVEWPGAGDDAREAAEEVLDNHGLLLPVSGAGNAQRQEQLG